MITGFGGFPGRFPNGPGYQQSPGIQIVFYTTHYLHEYVSMYYVYFSDEIKVQQVEAVDGQTVRLTFTVSPLIVGLHGRVEVRYTNREYVNLYFIVN